MIRCTLVSNKKNLEKQINRSHPRQHTHQDNAHTYTLQDITHILYSPRTNNAGRRSELYFKTDNLEFPCLIDNRMECCCSTDKQEFQCLIDNQMKCCCSTDKQEF